MDYRQLFSDPSVRMEFLDRFPELVSSAAARGAGLEGLEGGLSVDDAESATESMARGDWSEDHAGLEAIVQRFTRPVHLIQNATFRSPADGFPNSVEIGERLEGAREPIERAIPSAGRIDVRNHRLSWLGTGWVVAPGLVATNRHVAEIFARADNGSFAFRRTLDDRIIRPTMDWRHEHQVPAESRFRVTEVVWIEPDESFDVALLLIADEGEDGEPQPPPIDLMTEGELASAGVSNWVAVIGYPAQDSRNDPFDQQRIFDGIFDRKRLAVGQVTAIASNGILSHDATTLGGNSGSVLVDLNTGKAAALHFGGIEHLRNDAVQAPAVRRIVQAHGRP
jgi:hypothetical protein